MNIMSQGLTMAAIACALAASGAAAETISVVGTGAQTTASGTEPAQQYYPKAQTAGATLVWSETITRLNSAGSTRTRTNVTTSVANGIATVDASEGGTAVERYTSDADGNRLTRMYLNNGNVCTYAPKRDMLNFPLSVGKTWTTTWQYSCAAGYREFATLNAAVEALEVLAIPAGTFNALRIHYALAITNSNDSQLPGGSTGSAAYNQDYRCWWDVDGGRIVKCDFTYTYPAGAPSNFTKTFSQVATSVQ
ncbi:hypothetical protein [Ralstonia pseudosolanacearum]|uniref:Putative lipoprotein n=1 Tax=Ralstonia solanacearum TaxID=305 RepID=A0A0S4WEN7_RALSL|nr:hypothetical protein [Ralstonia pseudosolanacearum]CUV44814.1 putative lipoprotein [Ralstonia solanacearum]MDO3523867.1 hypothetical protein [Ralstonia pseudosolanacearum]MDO3548353.1 hypothetical protein [Ralstonia pseudosolanacearum]MDO3553178.1 hypothetical protein [Ralstonia pseudosolanacearum]MDO3556978.1 hypothetical protein [Ralstonia pseudosolanacearum]